MFNSLKERLEDSLKDLAIDPQRDAEQERVRIENEHEEAKKNVETQRGILGKAHDLIDGGKHREELEAAEFARLDKIAEEEAKRKKEQGLTGIIDDKKAEIQRKISDLAHQTTGPTGSSRKAESYEKRDQQNLSEKVQELWNHAPSSEKRSQEDHKEVYHDAKYVEATHGKTGDDGWRAKLKAFALGGHQEEKKAVERGWLKEKLNTMAGGGVESEANEDALDKTVDFVQQYLLGQGQQHDESALEQMTDEQISDAIRMGFKQATGHELPVKDK